MGNPEIQNGPGGVSGELLKIAREVILLSSFDQQIEANRVTVYWRNDTQELAVNAKLHRPKTPGRASLWRVTDANLATIRDDVGFNVKVHSSWKKDHHAADVCARFILQDFEDLYVSGEGKSVVGDVGQDIELNLLNLAKDLTQ
jgi:hypothetical protein